MMISKHNDRAYLRFCTDGSFFSLRRLQAHAKTNEQPPRELPSADDATFVAHTESTMQRIKSRFTEAYPEYTCSSTVQDRPFPPIVAWSLNCLNMFRVPSSIIGREPFSIFLGWGGRGKGGVRWSSPKSCFQYAKSARRKRYALYIKYSTLSFSLHVCVGQRGALILDVLLRTESIQRHIMCVLMHVCMCRNYFTAAQQ